MVVAVTTLVQILAFLQHEDLSTKTRERDFSGLSKGVDEPQKLLILWIERSLYHTFLFRTSPGLGSSEWVGCGCMNSPAMSIAAFSGENIAVCNGG